MLGTFGKSQFKTAEDFRTHKDYLTYMYGNAKGFITRSVIPQDHQGAYYESFSFSDRLINRNKYYGVTNVYTSMNTFLSKHKDGNIHSGRKVENLKRLNALYLDLDCYKTGMTQDQVLYELETDYFGYALPVPTFVIDSGRGLYLIWKIDEDRNALPRWKMVENYFLEQCKEFDADPQAIDAARILRVPYSINGKNGATVSIMRFNDVSYTLHEIISEYGIKPEKRAKKKETYPYGAATARQRRVAQWQAAEFGLELPDFDDYKATFDFIGKNSGRRHEKMDENGKVIIFAKSKTITSMLEGRVNDLFKLFSMRKGDDCSREYALFLCRLWTAERTNDFDYALEQTQALNRTFDVPFDEKYVTVRTKSAETKLKTGRTYQYGLSKLIEVLKITEEEQEKLDFLCIRPEAQAARKKIANRKTYLSRLKKNGKQTKSDTVRERREAVASLIAEGQSKGAICNMLQISERTYNRDKAAVIASGMLNSVKEAVKEVLEEGAESIKAASSMLESVKAAVKEGLEESAENIKDTVENVKQSLIAAVVSKKSTAEPSAPFFKHTYYERTTVGCPACAGAGGCASGEGTGEGILSPSGAGG